MVEGLQQAQERINHGMWVGSCVHSELEGSRRRLLIKGDMLTYDVDESVGWLCQGGWGEAARGQGWARAVRGFSGPLPTQTPDTHTASSRSTTGGRCRDKECWGGSRGKERCGKVRRLIEVAQTVEQANVKDHLR